MPRKAGLRTGVIYKMLDSYLFALSNGEIQLAGVHLHSLAKFLEIDIQPTPLINVITPSEAQVWLNYCTQNQPKVLVAVNKNLKEFSAKNQPFRLLRPNNNGDEDGEVEDLDE
jgi:hypothetical protein